MADVVITQCTHVVIVLVVVVFFAVTSAKSWSCLYPISPSPTMLSRLSR